MNKTDFNLKQPSNDSEIVNLNFIFTALELSSILCLALLYSSIPRSKYLFPKNYFAFITPSQRYIYSIPQMN